ncbi:MAG: hypothetical protein AB8B56_00220 [Crocinitomicaceae bacterium]
MIKKLPFALIAGSLLFANLSCKKEVINPTKYGTIEDDCEECQELEKNNGTIYFTRCPNVKNKNLGDDIWVSGKVYDPTGVSYGVDDVHIYVLDWTPDAPPPLVSGLTIDEFTYSEDGLYQIFQTPSDFILFDPNGPSPIGHTYTILSEAVDANGVVIESMECSIKITEPLVKGIKGVKTKVVERNNGTAELQVVVNPRDYIVLDWKSSDQLTISYDQVSNNPLLHAGNEYTLDFARMKDNGNLLFKTTLSGATNFDPSISNSVDTKWSISEEEVDPFDITIHRSLTQENINCSVEGMKLIDKRLNTYINAITANLNNDGTVTVNIKRTQKALLANGNDVSYARITLMNPEDNSLQQSYDRYEWDYDGDGASNYSQASLEELYAGMWDFDGDGLNDYEPKKKYKLKKLNMGYMSSTSQVWVNDVMDTRIELFDRFNNSMGFIEQLVTVEQ